MGHGTRHPVALRPDTAEWRYCRKHERLRRHGRSGTPRRRSGQRAGVLGRAGQVERVAWGPGASPPRRPRRALVESSGAVVTTPSPRSASDLTFGAGERSNTLDAPWAAPRYDRTSHLGYLWHRGRIRTQRPAVAPRRGGPARGTPEPGRGRPPPRPTGRTASRKPSSPRPGRRLGYLVVLAGAAGFRGELLPPLQRGDQLSLAIRGPCRSSSSSCRSVRTTGVRTSVRCCSCSAGSRRWWWSRSWA